MSFGINNLLDNVFNQHITKIIESYYYPKIYNDTDGEYAFYSIDVIDGLCGDISNISYISNKYNLPITYGLCKLIKDENMCKPHTPDFIYKYDDIYNMFSHVVYKSYKLANKDPPVFMDHFLGWCDECHGDYSLYTLINADDKLFCAACDPNNDKGQV
jgi:hypothetical protein